MMMCIWNETKLSKIFFVLFCFVYKSDLEIHIKSETGATEVINMCDRKSKFSNNNREEMQQKTLLLVSGGV